MLIEVAITKLPNIAEQQAGKSESLVLPYTAVTARDQNVALLLVGAAHADVLESLADHGDQLQVKIRAS